MSHLDYENKYKFLTKFKFNTFLFYFFSSGHQQHHHGHSSQNYPVPYDVLHPSLQRNAHSLMVDPMALQKANHMIHNRGVTGPGSSLSLATGNFCLAKGGFFSERADALIISPNR